MSSIFISHSSADNEQVQKLKERLESWNHHSVFLDFDPDQGIQAGRSWERTLYRKLRACRAVIAWCTDAYLASYWCFAEIALTRMEGKPIFAILDPSLSADATLPSILTEKQFLDLRKGESQVWVRLQNGLKDLDILGVSGDWDPGDPPYLGLNYYDEKHAPVFFGREDETRSGLELINRGAPNLLMVLGASGSGKSSLARAGIIPRLRCDVDRLLVVDPIRPRQDPFRELAHELSRSVTRFAPDHAKRIGNENAILRLLQSSGDTAAPTAKENKPEEKATAKDPDVERLERLLVQLEEMHENPPQSRKAGVDSFLDWSLDDLRRITRGAISPSAHSGDGDTPLNSFAEQLLEASGRRHSRLIIIIDQFEELLGFEEGSNDQLANRFLQQLRSTLDSENCRIMVLGTMRSDFLGSFQRNSALRGVDFESLSIGPMRLDGMRRVIVEPAKLGAIELENGLADRLLDDTETPDALPLLSFTLRVLWEKFHERGKIEIRDYEELGGLDGAVSKEADALLRMTENEGRTDELRRAFLRMARLSEEGSYARQPASWEAPEIAAVHDILDRFIERRLLLKLTDDKAAYVEVAHEALFRSWTPLKNWLDNNRADLILKQQISHDAKAWERDGKRQDRLWHGGRLLQARDFARRESLPDLEASFIEAGLERHRKQRRRRAALLTTAVAILAGFLVFSLWQGQLARQQRDAARRNEGLGWLLRADVAEKQGRQFPHTLLFAANAIGFDDVGRKPEPEPGMRQRISRLFGFHRETTQNPRLIDRHAHRQEYDIAQKWIEKRSHCFPYWRYTHKEKIPIISVTLHPLGRFLAASFDDGRIRIWDFQSGESNILRESGQSAAKILEFGPEGNQLFAAIGNQVLIWDIESRGWGGQILDHGKAVVTSLAFSNSGKLAVGTAEGVTAVWTSQDGGWVRNKLDLQKENHRFGRNDAVVRLAFNTYDLLAGGFSSGSLELWDLSEEKSNLRSLPGHDAAVTSLAFSPSGNFLVSSSEDRSVILWDAELGVKKMARNQTTTPRSVAFTPDGRYLAIGLATGKSSPDKNIDGGGKAEKIEGNVKIWKVDRFIDSDPKSEAEATLLGDGATIQSMDAGNGGGTFATGSGKGTLLLWNFGAPGKTSDPFDLFQYIERQWYAFDDQEQTVVWRGGTAHEPEFINLPLNSLPVVWHGSKDEKTVSAELVQTLVNAENWPQVVRLVSEKDKTAERLQELAAVFLDRGIRSDFRSDSWAHWTLLQRLRGARLVTGETPSLDQPGDFRNHLGMKMIWCAAGKFPMGSRYWEAGREDNELLHLGVVDHGFWIAAHELTQGVWLEVMGENPSVFARAGAYAPVENVTLADVLSFCEKLTTAERERGSLPDGWIYGLPSEEQWEYACRAGTDTTFYFGEILDGHLANCDGAFPYGSEKQSPFAGRTMSVGSYPPNPWQLFDTHGNVWEWCAVPQGKTPMLRGGGWSNMAEGCRTAKRTVGRLGLKADDIGFRVVLVKEN